MADGTYGDITVSGGGSVWTVNPGAVGPAEGGTGQSAVATGDLLYGSGANVWARRAAGTVGQHLEMAGGLPTWSSAHGVSLTSGAGPAAIPNQANTVIAWWNTPAVDPDAMFSAVAPDRVTIKVAGTYFLAGFMSWAPNETGVRQMFFYKGAAGGLPVHTGEFQSTHGTTDKFGRTTMAIVVRCDVNDYIQMGVFQSAVNAAGTFIPLALQGCSLHVWRLS